MARERPLLFSLNAGEVSPLAMARVDLQRMKLVAETYLNCIPRVIGPLQFRPGLRHYNSTKSEAAGRNIPFVRAADDTALLELTEDLMRIRIAGTLVSRTAVSTAVTNGDFSSSTGWTTTVTVNGVATISGGKLTLSTPTRGGTTLAKRSVSVAGGDQNVEHGLRIIVDRGPVKFRCGSTDGGDEYINETELKTGTHSIAFTPTGATFYVQFSVRSESSRIVDSITVDSSGTLELPTPWAVEDLFELRYVQSADVIFVAHGGYQPRRIERRGTKSWSVTLYEFTDGPWRGKTADIKLDPSVSVGNGTMSASAPFFKSTMVGALMKLNHTSTRVVQSIGGNDEFTDFVRVSGVRMQDVAGNAGDLNAVNERQLDVTESGTFSGTISVQSSYDEGLTWSEIKTFGDGSAPGSNENYGEDNAVTYIRCGFVAPNWTSGSTTITLNYEGGGGEGYVRITAFNSATSVDIEVLGRLHNTEETKDWEESRFSDFRGWPSAVRLMEGRLWFGHEDKIYGSVVDAFDSFNLEEDGDSGPIIRSVATGPVNQVFWLLDLARLMVGTVGSETEGKSSSFDEPMTPANFNFRDASTQGSTNIQAEKIDKSGVFVQRSGKRAYELYYSVEAQAYVSQELTRYHPTILDETVKLIAVQRQPDTRIWFVLNDGTAACLVMEKSEDVIAWCRFETDGDIEDIAVLPNTESDDVWMIVNRTINGSTKRYVEKLAYDSEAIGGTTNYMADSFVIATLTASTSVTGLSHLEGESVVVWAAGSPLLTSDGEVRTFTVSGGGITLPSAVTGTVITGLAYEGRWKSAKLAYGAQLGTALSQRKMITDFAPLLYKTHARAIRFAQNSFDGNMDYLPRIHEMTDRGYDYLYDTYDYDPQPLPGDWSTDSRLCMKFQAPCPATVLGFSATLELRENA
jgi:hypothetical protein